MEPPDPGKWPRRVGSDECHCSRPGTRGDWRVMLDGVHGWGGEGRVDEWADGGERDEIGFL